MLDEDWSRLGQGHGVFVVGAGNKGKRGKGIRKGEEVLVSYGKGFWEDRRVEWDVDEDEDGKEEEVV